MGFSFGFVYYVLVVPIKPIKPINFSTFNNFNQLRLCIALLNDKQKITHTQKTDNDARMECLSRAYKNSHFSNVYFKLLLLTFSLVQMLAYGRVSVRDRNQNMRSILIED